MICMLFLGLSRPVNYLLFENHLTFILFFWKHLRCGSVRTCFEDVNSKKWINFLKRKYAFYCIFVQFCVFLNYYLSFNIIICWLRMTDHLHDSLSSSFSHFLSFFFSYLHNSRIAGFELGFRNNICPN